LTSGTPQRHDLADPGESGAKEDSAEGEEEESGEDEVEEAPTGNKGKGKGTLDEPENGNSKANHLMMVALRRLPA